VSDSPNGAGDVQVAEKHRADASRAIRLERRTQPVSRLSMFRPLADDASPGAVVMDLTPFLDGPEHLDDIVRRCVEHGGSRVAIGEAGPGSLHTGHEAGLHYNVLTRSAVAEAAPELIFLHDNAATACLRMATGDDDLVPMPGERGINVNITDGEHVHEWHVGGPDLAYTSSTGLQVPRAGHGIDVSSVTYLDPTGTFPAHQWGDGDQPPESLRDRYGIVQVDPETPGAFVWHDGARKHATLIERGRTLVAPGMTPHGVNAVPPGFVRITLIMSWCWLEDAALAEGAEARYGVDEERDLADYLYGEDGHTGALRNTGGLA
jgi:hypothetical protein